MARWFWLCTLGLFFSISASAIEAVTAYTIFYSPESNKTFKPYAEIYWQIDPRSLKYTQNADGLWQAKIKTDIIFKSDTGKVMEEHFVLQTSAASTSDQAMAQSIIDMHRYALPVGKLSVVLSLTDLNSPENGYKFSEQFEIATHGPEHPFYSGIQLLDTAYRSDKKSIFSRGDNVQIPLSLNFLDDARSTIRFYSELYQGDKVGKDFLPLTQRVFISKQPLEGVVMNLQHTDTIQPATVVPLLGHFNIAKLPSGNYYLNIILGNTEKSRVATQSFFFQRSNTKPVVAEADTATKDTAFVVEKVNVFDVSSTFVKKYTLPQLKAILKMLLPISSAVEIENIKNLLRKPDETYMRYFVYNFWKSRNGSSPQKEWEQYTVKVKEVNRMFGATSLPGYETERGAVYLKFGPPTDRITVENETGTLPYEVWAYNNPGDQGSPGAFLFYRPGYMVNDYKLLHTTVRGEMRNLSWRNTLYVTGSASGNLNARAEQYFGNR